MQFAGRLERDFGDLQTSRILEYNYRRFNFSDGVIPDLTGTGVIVVVTKQGLQYQGHRGYFDNLTMCQIDGASFINGVLVGDLVGRMEEVNTSLNH